ncbi:MAG: homocysteine S-methyltransferase family protein [Anaerolineales bacterium]|nr:homocysteine S-methyltransferase family protein [Anaerolineales bacterium]
MNPIQSLLSESKYILADGGMGTMLFASGLEHGYPPEKWNLEHPERVAAVHRAYLEAGAQLVLTNTFGGNRLRLSLHGGLETQVEELNQAAAKILRAEVDTHSGNALVVGDIGPTGQVLLPYGELAFEDAVEAFREQAAALISGKVDLIWTETMADLEEVRAAVEGIRQVSADIPIITTMTFDTYGRTMMGVTPEQALETLKSFGPVALGGNCGNGPEEILSVIEKMHSKDPEVILVAKANAGIPELVDGRPVYGASPATMADYALKTYAAGAKIIGSCCGSTPDHVRAIGEALAAHTGA